MKLVYWVANIRGDSASYNIRARTKRECITATLAGAGHPVTSMPLRFGKPHKVTVEYRDAFDLADKLLGEGGSDIELAGAED